MSVSTITNRATNPKVATAATGYAGVAGTGGTATGARNTGTGYTGVRHQGRARRVDPQIVELVKALIAPLGTTAGVAAWYLLYRKFDAERAASLRTDIATANSERDTARKELREERADHKATRDELRAAEETIDQLREEARGKP